MKLNSEKIYALLVEKNLTNKQLCDSIKMNTSYFCQILRLENVRYKTVYRIAKGLNVEPQDIIRKEI